jgi:hypothetical protein
VTAARRRAAALMLGAAALAGLPACTQLEPDVGGLLAGGCKDVDSDPGRPISFAGDVRPLLDRPLGGCSCHLPNGTGPGPGIQLAGLNLVSYATLRAGGASSGPRIAIPGQPCDSLLYLKIGTAPPFGSRMPLNGPPYYTPAEIQLISDWIAEGALDN